MLNNKAKNITMIGMPSVGKSTLGKKLSKKLHYKFLDTDKVIEKQIGLAISEIIDKYGEEKFSKIEKKVIADISNVKNCVISTGGSAVYSKKSMALLKKSSVVIFLKVPFKIIEERLSKIGTKRIIRLKGRSLRKLYGERNMLYKKYADIAVDVSAGEVKNLENIVKKIKHYENNH